MKQNSKRVLAAVVGFCVVFGIGCGQSSTRMSSGRGKARLPNQPATATAKENRGPVEWAVERDPNLMLAEASFSRKRRKLDTRAENERVHVDAPLVFQSEAEIDESRMTLRSARPGDRLIRVVGQFAHENARVELAYDRDQDAFFFPLRKAIESETSELRLKGAATAAPRKRRRFELLVEFSSGKSEHLSLDFEVLLPLKPLSVVAQSRLSTLSVGQVRARLHEPEFVVVSETWSNLSDEALRVRFVPTSSVVVTSILARQGFVQESAGSYRETTRFAYGRARLEVAGVGIRAGETNEWASLAPSEDGVFSTIVPRKKSVELQYRFKVRAEDRCRFPENESVTVTEADRWSGRINSFERTVSSQVVGYQFDGAVATEAQLFRASDESAAALRQSMRSDVLGGVGEPLKGDALPCQGIY